MDAFRAYRERKAWDLLSHGNGMLTNYVGVQTWLYYCRLYVGFHARVLSQSEKCAGQRVATNCRSEVGFDNRP